MRKVVQMPLRQIAENAGEDGAVISGKIRGKSEYNLKPAFTRHAASLGAGCGMSGLDF